VALVGNQVEFLPFHAQFPAQIRVYDDPSLSIHFDIGSQVRCVERDVVGCVRVLLERIEKFLVYPPLGYRVELSYAAIEAGQMQLALRQTLEKLDEISWKFEPSFVVETPGVSTSGEFDGQCIRNWLLITHFLTTFIPLS
jgi:hypothetical protein